MREVALATYASVQKLPYTGKACRSRRWPFRTGEWPISASPKRQLGHRLCRGRATGILSGSSVGLNFVAKQVINAIDVRKHVADIG